jgi:putative Ca2+/H+ antiporter (TMEM165/GDT1 family)
MFAAFFAAYAAVFIAEIVGDKLLYTSGILATRFRWGPVISGMSLAFMAKMAVAVALGAAIGELLQPWLVAVLTAVSFIGVAITVWRQPDVRVATQRDAHPLKGAAVTFSTILLAEWGDKGMMTAGVFAAAAVSQAPKLGAGPTGMAWVVWLAAVLAMVTKGGLAVTLGARARRWIAAHVSPRNVRYGAVAALVVLGVLCVLEVMGILVD